MRLPAAQPVMAVAARSPRMPPVFQSRHGPQPLRADGGCCELPALGAGPLAALRVDALPAGASISGRVCRCCKGA